MDLEARITRLEDIESIRQLKATYCEICDDDHNPDRIVTIFTEDGIWEGKGIGRAEGHHQIRALFQGFQKAIRFSQHMVHNPIIDVTGDIGSAKWYFHGMFTMEKGSEALWQACRYHEKYEKQDGVWKIKHLHIKGPRFAAPYAQGWQK